MKYNTITLIIVSALSVTACGDNNLGSEPPAVGRVALYVTDNLDNYTDVTGTINHVSLGHKGTGAQCVLFNDPQSFNFAALGAAQVMELLTVSTCPAGSYNRLHINVDPTVSLTNSNGDSFQCVFTAYKDEHDHPNAMNCDANGCGLMLTGATNVLAHQANDMALDFDLKSFEVDFVAVPCEVTMKVSPLHSAGMSDKEQTGYSRIDEM